MIFAEMERGSGIAGQGRDVADMARFIAYTGCRRGEAAAVKWSDVDFGRGLLNVRGTKTAAANREVPLIPAARDLLTTIRERRMAVGEVREVDRVLAVSECSKSLTRACKAVGTPRLTHHDLRDAFATTAIESGVDIPTVASWLGHADGGALLMRVYTHHRRPHSLAQAAKVTF
jgi:integrase